MIFHKVNKNQGFIGRESELRRLHEFENLDRAAIFVMYGRRRVGKTELIEQAFSHCNILKFEGLERLPEKDQIKQVLYQASKYFENPYIARMDFTTWVEVFDFIADQ